MLIKSIDLNEVNVSLYCNKVFDNLAYTVVTESFSRSFLSVQDALEMFDQLVGTGVLWN